MIHLENPSIAPCTTRRHLWKVNKAYIVIDCILHYTSGNTATYHNLPQSCNSQGLCRIQQTSSSSRKIFRRRDINKVYQQYFTRGVWEQTGKMLRFKFYYLGFMHSISQCSDEKDFQGGGGGLGSWLSSRGFALLQMKFLCIFC